VPISSPPVSSRFSNGIVRFLEFAAQPRGARFQAARGGVGCAAMGAVRAGSRGGVMGRVWAAAGGGLADVGVTGGVAAGAAGLATGQPDAKLPNRRR
jgi:hypothetical protein